jgi:GNAT superfamily N-acetyltransferase
MILCLRDLNYTQQSKITERLCALDKQVYGICKEPDLGRADYWMSLQTYDFCFTQFLNGEPIAYLDFLSLHQYGVEIFMRQEIHDGEIDLAWLQKPEPKPELLQLYAASLVVAEPYRRTGIVHALLHVARQYFIDHDFLIYRTLATTWSTAGEKLVLRLGGQRCNAPAEPNEHKRFFVSQADETLPRLRP